jgi:hypothetical protein
MKVINLTPDQIKAWQTASLPAIDEFINTAGPDAKKLVEEVRKLY